MVFWASALTLLTLLTLATVIEIDVTDRARGVLRPLSGVRVLTSQTEGTVKAIAARSGDMLRAGAPIVQLESLQLEALTLEAKRQLQLLEAESGSYTAQRRTLVERQGRVLQSRFDLLTSQVASQEESVAYARRRLDAYLQLEKAGLTAALAVNDARDALAAAERQLATGREALQQARQELVGIEIQRTDEAWRSQQALSEARARVDALGVRAQQLLVRAPVDGLLESLSVKAGDAIRSGSTVAKLVPGPVPFRVLASLPERDRSSVRVGDQVAIEFDQLPYTEYGAVCGGIVRISGDLASAREIQEGFGDLVAQADAAYLVEIDLTGRDTARFRSLLRSGMLVTVRYTLRRRRPIQLLLAPIRSRWRS
jgi:multidrug resistance efflux pump